ncbi:hypothetical protein EJB05_20216, partial [Eragrostis curvula]
MAVLRAFVLAAAVALALSMSPRGAEAKTTIEPCSGSDSCPALLGYTLYADMKVSEVAALFGADPAALLAANAFDFTAPGAAHRILPMGLFVRVPTRCACADGVRKSVSVRYAARPGDTLAAVADVVFAGLASADQIRDENGLASADPDAPLSAGEKLVVPLPCVCFNSSDNNLPALYLSYVVQVGDTVPAIAATYETTVTDVMNVNAMGTCASTFPKSSSDHGLIVANGTYALTAGNCVQCSCGPGSLNLDTGLQPRCPGPHQLPTLTDPPTTVNHDSTYLPPLSAPAPAEAGGIIPAPASSVQGGSFTLPKVSTANGPAGSVSEAPSMKKQHQILVFFIVCLAFYSM